MDGVGLATKNFLVYTSIGTGLLSLLVSFIVPETTISSNKASDSVNSIFN